MREYVLVKVRFNQGVPHMLFAKSNPGTDRIAMFGANTHNEPGVMKFTTKTDAMLFRDKQTDYDWQVVQVQ